MRRWDPTCAISRWGIAWWIPSTIGCGTCVYCRAGYYAQCDNANPNGKRAGTTYYGGPKSSGPFQGLQADIGAYIPRILEAGNTRYVPRSSAEDDPSLKQIIPYVLVRKGDTLLHYVRGKGSGEKRLVAKGSIGIGGHINHPVGITPTGRSY